MIPRNTCKIPQFWKPTTLRFPLQEGGVALSVIKLPLLLPLPKTPLAEHFLGVRVSVQPPRAKTLGRKSGGLRPRHSFITLQLCGPGKLPEPPFPPLETNKGGCLTRVLGLCNRTGSNKDFMNSMVKFLNPGASDFVDQTTLYCRGLSCASRVVSSILSPVETTKNVSRHSVS